MNGIYILKSRGKKERGSWVNVIPVYIKERVYKDKYVNHVPLSELSSKYKV